MAKDISILSKRMEDFCNTLSGICRIQNNALDGGPRPHGTAAASGGTAPQDAGRLPTTPCMGSTLLPGDSPHDVRDEASNITGLETHRSMAPSSPSWRKLGATSQRATIPMPGSPVNYASRPVSEPQGGSQDGLTRQRRGPVLQRCLGQPSLGGWSPPRTGNVSPATGNKSPARSHSPTSKSVVLQAQQTPLGSATLSTPSLSQPQQRLGESQPRPSMVQQQAVRMISTPAAPYPYSACQSPSPRQGPTRQSSIAGLGSARLMESPRRHFSLVISAASAGQHMVQS